MQCVQKLHPCSNEVLFLLTEDYASVLDSLARHIDQVAIIGAENATHSDCAVQLLRIIFTEAS